MLEDFVPNRDRTLAQGMLFPLTMRAATSVRNGRISPLFDWAKCLLVMQIRCFSCRGVAVVAEPEDDLETVAGKEVGILPRFDGTGPQGRGPMSGRCRGFCVLKIGDSDAPSPVAPYAAPYGATPTPQQEAEMLKEQAKYFEESLDGIRKRIEELDIEKSE